MSKALNNKNFKNTVNLKKKNEPYEFDYEVVKNKALARLKMLRQAQHDTFFSVEEKGEGKPQKKRIIYFSEHNSADKNC